MRRIGWPIVAVAVGGMGAVSALAGASVPAARVSKTVQSFVQTYCVRCHGPRKQKGNLRLDQVSTVIDDGTVALQWQDILDMLNLSEMPPEDATQPPREALANTLESLTGSLVEARNRLTDSGGHVVLRRLNRREYRRTIEALFGVPVEAGLLPEDGRVDGFDTLGQANGFSSLHLERYLELGRRVLDRSFERRSKKRKNGPRREQAEARPNREMRDQIPHIDKKIATFDKNIANGRKQHVAPRAVKVIERRMVDAYLNDPATKTGAVIPFQGMNPTAFVQMGGKAATGRYRIRVRVGAAQKTPAKDLFMKVVRGQYRSTVPDSIDLHRITGTMDRPQVIEFEVDIDNILANRFEFHRWDIKPPLHPQFEKAKDYWFRFRNLAYHYEDKRPSLWIDWLEYEGPLPAPAAPLSAEKLLAGRDPDKLVEADAQSIIERFAYTAFRREAPDSAYVDRLMGIFRTSRARGASFEDALQDALVVVLASPRFLFLNEPKEDGGKSRPLTDRELAVRLSYFLWSAPPDDTLYALAEEGRLRDPKVLAGQVDRMVQSDRSDHFVETFLTQWLELDRLNAISPDSVPSAHYDQVVHVQSRREVYAFFSALLRENLPATNLLDSDFAVVDAAMARFYDLPTVNGEGFEKVKLPAGSVRGGLLGQSAILALTGTGDRTSPVERGAFVLRKLLHRPPPAAPANVPMLDEKNVGSRSIKDTLAAHMSKAQCQSCHRRIDPLGFALENFDPVGRWRESVKSADGSRTFTIDASGVMPDGKSRFSDLHGMKAHLARHESPMMTGLTEALMTYALGRTIGFTDRQHVDQIVRDTVRDQHRLRTLVRNIVLSKPFMSK